MKELIQSVMRHACTALAACGVLLASKGLIAPEDTAAVNAAGATLGDALTVILVAVVGRLVIYLVQFFTPGGAKTDGLVPLCIGFAALGLFGGLVSCSNDQIAAARSIPIKACYIDPHGTKICYSAKSGLEASYVDPNSGK